MEPVSRLPVADIVLQRIVEHVRSCNLQPGDKLPTEKELVRDLKVSRASVREAMRSLLATGMIELQPGLGAFVAEPKVLTLLAHGMVPSLLHNPRDLEIFMEARRVIEPEITAMAATRATEEDLQAIESALRTFEAAAFQGSLDEEPQVQFHHALLRASGNWVLVEMMLPIIRFASKLVLQIGERQQQAMCSEEFHHQQVRMHRELFAAVRSRNPTIAREAALRHIDAALADAHRVLTTEP